MKIKSTNFGLAYQYDDVIEINPILKQYPKLYKETLKHEKEHLKSKGKVDFWIDLKNTGSSWQWMKFMFEHPKPFFQSMLPVWKCKKQWCVNYYACILYGGLILISTTLVMI